MSSKAALRSSLVMAALFLAGTAAAFERVEDAQAALEEIAAERARIQALHAQEELACRDRFFVTRCVDQAKDRRGEALAPLEKRELEANHFLRAERAAERDRALAEREARARAKEARVQAEAEPRAPRGARADSEEPDASHTAERLPRPALSAEQERQVAQRQARNEAAYARKLEEARARQQAVARRKEEKEKKQSQR